MQELVCDSNVFYDIATSEIDAHELTEGGNRKLLASPMTIVEILSRVSESSFSDRKKAAIELEKRAEIIPNVEYELAKLFRVEKQGGGSTDWFEFLQILVRATDYQQYCDQVRLKGLGYNPISLDVFGVVGQGTTTVDHEVFGKLRDAHEENFYKGIRNAIEAVFPGYKKRLNKQKVGIPVEKRSGGEQIIMEADFLDALFEFQRGRVLISSDFDESKAENLVSPEIKNNAYNSLECYMKIYREFMRQLVMGDRGNHLNDFGDLEFFIHIRPGRVFVTSESKWSDLATKAGVSRFVVTPKKI